MPEIHESIAQHYHERTKYDPETLAAKSQGLDWAKQPVPFKEYKIGSTFDLKPHIQQTSERFANNPEAQWWQRLSRLLFRSYGLTARMPSMGSTIYLRAAPSAGGLYPAEVYVVSRGTPLLPPGLYNYQCRTHSLMHYWESDVWPALQSACFWHPAIENTQLAIIITGVFYRSAWRYEDRAYRRICLDAGHLLGNIELAAAMNDYRPHLIGGFVDQAVNDLLYIDSEQEGTLAVLPLADLLDIQQNLPLGCTALPSACETNYPLIPDGQLLKYFHIHTQIPPDVTGKVNLPKVKPQKTWEDKYNFSFCLKIPTATAPIDWGLKLSDLENTMYKRRSTRAYSGEALTCDELKSLLDFTYQPQNYLHQSLDSSPDYFDLSLIETFIAVSSVKGLESGCYYYAPKAQELRQIRFKNFRTELHFLCLGQHLGRDAAAVLFHTADLKSAIAQYGDRVYRYLHMDAGHLGQRLNLAATHLGLGVSGIGGFFDDQVNEILGIPADEAVIYVTTLGRPR
ncbi:SagB/ThcOx family dehydrogenase [Umezakia ovalisporum]|jgi:SagB-type dehydrogenase family enzyme|uniref:SagB/ThcOx family dehydrogenase n=2 Tax=Umezakia ovalisporum TaxID=75695 RepID=A0AA43H139_9CYAN|nr:SagB/ThcOx family dehydrogenase [Umezakia ovalisporum]MBI1241912.1 SagB/ThcOx family dehydrogenase [Nostoc sp. RI_552]MDH6058547.1 SagB/ThcOx family dehydrogenase [Umezakia ovalisporum FSS-43]MDH6064967.1 SagB/ThcOx family dehydrogenase [Umezakia ovalisporum FSS-62]MDH6067599.1 SagB/ThcOx family dehydrogenase [Umezakia ovalisporum APH033B]MDH6069470.1 SagB/ThcOx family dehydrogenase [Umezakia ovalisporum CobakiLakeA]